MNENEFDKVADTFRSDHIWTKDEKGYWKKNNIWDT